MGFLKVPAENIKVLFQFLKVLFHFLEEKWLLLMVFARNQPVFSPKPLDFMAGNFGFAIIPLLRDVRHCGNQPNA